MADENKPAEKPLSIVEQAEKLRDEIKAENDRREKLLQEEQKLHAERLLTGTAGAHIEAKPAPVETAKEYAEKVLKGEIKAK